MPCGYRVNPEVQEELGFVPLLAAAPSVIGGAGKLLGGLFGKKKKKAAPPPAPAPVAPAATPSKPVSAPSSGGASISKALAGIPTPPKDVRAEALAALKTYQQSNRSDKQKDADLVAKLAAVVKPAVAKIQADVKTQALKTQVTSEHNKLVQDKERWEANDAAHRAIMAKFDQLEAALTNSNARTKRVFKIYGINV